MFKSFAAAFLIGALAFAAPATAQDADDEVVVVTGTRYTERYEDFAVPHVAIVRRADSAAQNFTLSSDTRDPAARRSELTEALRGLARAAGTGGVTLGIYDDDDEGGRSIVIPFSVEAGLELIRQGSRPDTSQVSILLRTDIRAGDTYADVEQRFEQFEQRAPRPGRVEYFVGNIDLVLLNPPQYRTAVVAEIAADSSRLVAALGPGYGVRLEGLKNPIAWKRAGDLQLRLFVPYRMVVLPRDAAS